MFNKCRDVVHILFNRCRNVVHILYPNINCALAFPAAGTHIYYAHSYQVSQNDQDSPGHVLNVSAVVLHYDFGLESQ